MKWMNNLNVSTRITLTGIILVLLIIVVSVINIFQIQSSSRLFDSFYNNQFTSVITLNQIARHNMQKRINMLRAKIEATSGNFSEVKNLMDEVNELHNETSKIGKIYLASDMDEKEKELVDAYKKYYYELTNIFKKFSKAILNDQHEESLSFMNDWAEKYKQVREINFELIAYNTKTAKEAIANEKAQLINVEIFIIIALFTAIIFGIAAIWLIIRSISMPIQKDLKFAERIAQGDFSNRIDLNQNDELGQLAEALNNSAESLAGIISDVIDSAENLAQATEQISSGNQNLSQRTSEQSSSLEEIAATLEESTASIKQNSENSEEANRLSIDASMMAEEGGKVVNEAVISINEINQSSKKIGEITTVLNEISFQTNLLALNAAVEAARAGEHGRGFAVVAGEVRNLAQRSASSSKEIETLIQDSVDKIYAGTKLVNQSGEALQKIIEATQKVSKTISEIVAASEEQKQGIEQINIAVGELDSMTQQNAALVEETASASEEMSSQSKDLLLMMSRFNIHRQKLDINKNNINTMDNSPADKEENKPFRRKTDDIKDLSIVEPVVEKERKDLKSILLDEGFAEF
ncbi:MAG: methyl-accepting chemotaxis protein [Spirochaetota bacterium]|nr:methyl-accepting chemotaxis protein [Spirochaetota bacterium]